MVRLETLLLITSMIIIGFHAYGLIDDTPISNLITSLLNPEDFFKLGLSEQLTNALALAGFAGIIAASFFSTKVQWVVVTLYASSLILIAWEFILIFNLVAQSSLFLATVFVSPVILLFIQSIMTWWKT